MIVTLGLEVKADNKGLQTTVQGLEQVEKQFKKTKQAAEDTSTSFGRSARGAGELAGAAGTAAKKLAGAADMFGLPAGALRSLDDAMDVAELGLAGLGKSALSATPAVRGFWLAALGPVAAVAAAAVALGTFLNRFEAVRAAADAATGPLARFLGLAGEVQKFSTSTKDFSAAMAKSHEGAIEKQVAQMRELGKSTKEILAFYKDQRLSDGLKERLGLTEKTVKAEEAAAVATKKHRQELEGIISKIRGSSGMDADLAAGASVTAKDWARMTPGIVTSLSQGSLDQIAPVTASVPKLRAMGEGAMATTLSLSYSQALDQKMKERAQTEAKAKEGTDRLINTFGALASQLTNLRGVVGGFAGKLLGILSSLSSGAGGIFSGLKGFSEAKGLGGLTGLLGKVTSSLGMVGSAIGVVGGVIGGIKSLFGGKSKEEKEAERQAKLQAEAEAKAAKEEAARLRVEGLRAAQSSAESLMGRMSGGNMSEALQAALGTVLGKVQDALLKNGLGYMATGALRESKQYTETQGAAGDLAGVVRGMRQGGAVDTALLAASGAAAKEMLAQAITAAKEAGLADAEASKAGFGAVADVLREQLNASIQSGQALDENTKAMLEEAKKNGIEILADPQIESLAVQREMLGELRGMNRGGYGRPPDEEFATGTRGLRVLRTDMIAKVHAGEGMMVIPKDEMRGMGYGSYARGFYDDSYDRRSDRTGTAGGGAGGGGTTYDAAAEPSGEPSGGGGSASTATTAAAVQAALAPLIETMARAAASPSVSVPVTYAPQVTLEDKSVVQTPESVRAMENLVVGSLQQALESNSRSVRTSFKQLVTEVLRESGVL